jgi:hypothetical protein
MAELTANLRANGSNKAITATQIILPADLRDLLKRINAANAASYSYIEELKSIAKKSPTLVKAVVPALTARRFKLIERLSEQENKLTADAIAPAIEQLNQQIKTLELLKLNLTSVTHININSAGVTALLGQDPLNTENTEGIPVENALEDYYCEADGYDARSNDGQQNAEELNHELEEDEERDFDSENEHLEAEESENDAAIESDNDANFDEGFENFDFDKAEQDDFGDVFADLEDKELDYEANIESEDENDHDEELDVDDLEFDEDEEDYDDEENLDDELDESEDEELEDNADIELADEDTEASDDNDVLFEIAENSAEEANDFDGSDIQHDDETLFCIPEPDDKHEININEEKSKTITTYSTHSMLGFWRSTVNADNDLASIAEQRSSHLISFTVK